MSAEQQVPAATPASFPNSSLYVGDLRDDVGETDIYDAFKECGPILSVRVCRDVKNQNSLGYAYVNFQSHDNAQKALDTLDGKQLKGKPCRVMWSRRDPSQRKSNEGNLFVKCLDKSITLVQLKDVFSHFGAISSCKVVTEDDGTSRGYGFVQFEKIEDSVKALEASKTDKDQFKVLGEKLVCENFVPRRLRANNANDTYTNIYVKYIGKKFTTDDLVKMFEQFGKITSPVVMMNASNNESRCFGFVNFDKHEDAVKAKEAMDGKAFKWKDDALVGPLEEGEDEEQLKKDGISVLKLYVNRAMKKYERERTRRGEVDLMNRPMTKTNLYIRNLADDVTDEDLRNLFKDFGEIKSCIVMKHNGVSKGFGFCDFENAESASEAIQKVMGQLFHSKPLYVALAQKKTDRRAMLESQRSQQRMYPVMGGMVRQQLFTPNMMYGFPNIYPYMQRQMFPRQPSYPRTSHYGRPNQGRRPNKQQQGQMQQQQQQPAQIPQQQAQPAVQAQPAAAPVVDEKQRVGEAIYTRIMPMYPGDQALWGKLTGMLLESIELPVLQGLLNDEGALKEKISQAKEYYDQHSQAQ